MEKRGSVIEICVEEHSIGKTAKDSKVDTHVLWEICKYYYEYIFI